MHFYSRSRRGKETSAVACVGVIFVCLTVTAPVFFKFSGMASGPLGHDSYRFCYAGDHSAILFQIVLSFKVGNVIPYLIYGQKIYKRTSKNEKTTTNLIKVSDFFIIKKNTKNCGFDNLGRFTDV